MTQINKIPFHSPEGQQLLQESSAFQTLLTRLFKKQENNTFCGVQSSALLLSAQHFGAKFPDVASQKDCSLESPPYVEGNMFSYTETKAAMDEAKVDAEGCTMEQVYNLFKQHGRNIKMYHADTVTVDEFRSLASKALSHHDSSWGVIANFDEYDLQQDFTVHGHFSPLAAYHAPTDRFLLLDTWMNTVDVWVKTEDMFAAMKTIDSDTNKYRGFIILES
ncbi:uncharacterized protein [Amphiura filiformis]